MGNAASGCCFCPRPRINRGGGRRRLSAAVSSEPFDDGGLGHSFCYFSGPLSKDPNFVSISGASVSANPSTALSTSLDAGNHFTAPAAFESSHRFSSLPLHPAAADRGFLSGPIERSFLSGPLDAGFLSGPLVAPKPFSSNRLKRSLSHSHRAAASAIRGLSKAISRTVGGPRAAVIPSKDPLSAETSSGFISVDDINEKDPSLQWAQGKAGEDRMHVVVSEDRGWVFVGIYDGFNGPDATDYLLANLYYAVHAELESLDLGGGGGGGGGEPRAEEVLKALARALMNTEDSFLDCADLMSSENPELALMGSCVLVMMMRGDDVYLMNVGDSRAVLATQRRGDLRSVGEESLGDGDELLSLDALQLTSDHSTSVHEEVVRIRNEHPDDSMAIANGRVKGSLKVTRAFGAGFLKQPKWNNALLEMFRIDYIGTSPYITCTPSLRHHKVCSGDRFLILSSDGLYQYFTNEEAVTEVELFISTTPEGDPAQHLLEELLFRAAKKAGMDFHELLEIPQGDRRRYHDDVSVIVISLEGRIWRSCM